MAEVQELARGGAAVALNDAIGVAEARTQFVPRFPRGLSFSGNHHQPLYWNAPHPAAGCVVLRTAAEFQTLWAEHRGAIAHRPEVDFDNFMVLAVFAGEGFFREVPSIERVKVLADELVVYVSRFSRPWSTHNAKAVIQVPQTDLPVRFVYLS